VEIASAQKLSAFKHSFTISGPTGTLQLMSSGALTRGFFIGLGSEVVAMVDPLNPFTRKAEIELLSNDVDFPSLAFAFWLVVLTWRRQQG
jgi:hypothetical protein